MTLAERFWKKVEKSGPIAPGMEAPCWLWTGAKRGSGHGMLRVDGANVSAHRVAWELADGPIPEGMQILHRCDVRPCVNRAHLFLGTNADNVADKTMKGRAARVTGDRNGSRTHPETRPRGERHPHSKLTAIDVAEIRRRYAAGGVRQKDLGAEYGVSQAAVSAIVRGDLWASDTLFMEASA